MNILLHACCAPCSIMPSRLIAKEGHSFTVFFENSNIFPEEEYKKRLEYELKTIIQMNFEDYFLIVYDFILFAKKNNILVGPGRGSAAGSLVAFCLGITDIDPIRYGLIFEK